MTICFRGGFGGNVTFRGRPARVLLYFVGTEDECRDFILNNQPDFPN